MQGKIFSINLYSGVSIAAGLAGFTEFMSLNTDPLKIIGADGTSVNTGWLVC